MSIAEFYMENGIDPGDPDSLDAYLDGASEGNHDGAWAYAGMREAEGIVVVDAPPGSDFDRSGQWDAVLAGAARIAGPPAGLNMTLSTPAIASRVAAGAANPADIHPGAVAPTWVIEATATDVTAASKTAATYCERLHAAVRY